MNERPTPRPSPRPKRSTPKVDSPRVYPRPNFRLILCSDAPSSVLWRDGDPPYDQEAEVG